MDQFALDAIKAWNQRPPPQYRLIDVTPINPSIGAVIDGVDLSREISRNLCHPSRANSDPEILVVAADETSENVAGEGWHTDVTFEERPPMGSIL
jgi:taurine dioxygenase